MKLFTILTICILAVAGLIAQDAIVISLLPYDSNVLAKKYAAYEKAKVEWETARADAVKKYSTKDTQYGLKFSEAFEYAVPDVCPVYHSPWGITWSNANTVPLTTTLNSDVVGWR